ncbi:MAG: AMP-binding protein [Bacteroidales bacterium]
MKEHIIGYIEQSIRQNWDIEALSNYRERGYTYKEIAALMLKYHLFFRDIGIVEGDKIALIGRNSANWCVIYLSVLTYGAVVVPILPDFKPDDLVNLVNHSDSKLMFADEKIFETIRNSGIPAIAGVISLDDFSLLDSNARIKEAYSLLNDKFAKAWPELRPDLIRFANIDSENLAVISYTGGTIGFSKGVMIPYRSLTANIKYAQEHMPLKPGDPLVSFLPLAHTYGCAFEFLFLFTFGCHITILSKTPSPQIILQAFSEIKPRLILSVPLVIEKIFKKQILPVIRKPQMKVLLAIPGLNKIIHKKIKDKLTDSFGGRFTEVVIGGAALNSEAESFFRKIGFRFTVGYGMTECGPLISYASWDTTRLGASGKAVDTLEITIDSSNPEKEVGEIILRGDNVMLGYYKNEKATKEIIDEKGWMHTGDLGVIDKDGNIYIKGRSKVMILGPSGKNIFPEEIEAVINNMDYIAESLVILEDNKLIGLIYPDFDMMKKDGIPEDQLSQILEKTRKSVNEKIPEYMAVTKFRIQSEEFIKTPKRSIRRFLYTKD